ncbi:hypothetical protein [Kangiella shandongensis]|uniref:hypothetical protein n=1 Tax=Kangiella shandongensis TaxID=2763258 RepID=UPI001CC10843|nr:hypothetical protein [Kangiella shandongensis]
MKLGITGKHSFFTILAKSLSLDSSAVLSSDDKKHFWDKVAFYNFCQEIVAEKARKSPSPQIWKLSTEPFYEVLNELKPDLILVLGKRLSYNLPKIPDNIKYKVINHPSSGFSYARWIPQIKEALINSGAKLEHKL